jgi:hypothetical protein
MSGLLDLIDEEMNKSSREGEEGRTILYSLGEIVEAANAGLIKPAVHDGKRFMTIVCKDGKFSLEPTTKDEYEELKARRGR